MFLIVFTSLCICRFFFAFVKCESSKMSKFKMQDCANSFTFTFTFTLLFDLLFPFIFLTSLSFFYSTPLYPSLPYPPYHTLLHSTQLYFYSLFLMFFFFFFFYLFRFYFFPCSFVFVFKKYFQNFLTSLLF